MTKSIILVGVGGQGTILASKLLTGNLDQAPGTMLAYSMPSKGWLLILRLKMGFIFLNG